MNYSSHKSEEEGNLSTSISRYSGERSAPPLQPSSRLAQKQENLINQFESNLKRTMELLGTPSPTSDFVSDKKLADRSLNHGSPTGLLPPRDHSRDRHSSVE